MPRPQQGASQKRKRRSRPVPRWLTKTPDLDAVARNRVMLVLSVLSGEKPVTTAIEESGISRGFYYQLETKAINAMLLALAPGSDGDSSPDATGLHHRVKVLEEKLARAEQAQRRAERLLFVQRKLTSSGPMKTQRGRPAKTTTSSTRGGRRSWRSSMRTKATTTKSSPPSSTTKTVVAPATKPVNPPASIPTPAGGNVVP
jgi:hypothetical protein